MPTLPPDESGTPTPPQNPVPSKETLDTLERMKEIYSTIAGQGAILNKEFASYAALAEYVTQQHARMAELSLDLVRGKKAEGAELLRRATEAKTAVELSERYLSVQKGVTKELFEQVKISRSIKEVGHRLGLPEEDIAKAMRRSEIDFAGARLETGLSKVSGITSALSALGAVFAIDFQSRFAGATGRGMTAARGAGYELTQADVQSRSNQMFGAFGVSMGPLERVEAFTKIVREAPQVFEGSRDKMRGLIGTMTAFGASSDQIIQTLIRGNRELNLNTNDLANSYLKANIIAKDLGLSTLEIADSLLAMTAEARHSGGSIKDAQAVLMSFGKSAEAAGIAIAPAERMFQAQKFAQGVFNMPVDRLMGLSMFTSGKGIEQLGEKDLAGGAPLAIAQKTWDKISRDVGGSYGEQILATQKVGQLLGVNVSNLYEVKNLQNILNRGIVDQEEADKELQRMIDPMGTIAKGIADMPKITDPLKSIDNTTQKILAHFSSLGTLMQNMTTTLAALKVITSAGSATNAIGNTIHGIATGATAARITRGGWMGTRALMAAGRVGAAVGAGVAAGEVAIPLIIGSGLVWGAHKLLDKDTHASEK